MNMQEERRYDLEAQSSILQGAVELDARASNTVSRQDLLAAAEELGISERAVLQAISAYDQKNAKKPHVKFPLSASFGFGAQTLMQWIAFTSFLYHQTPPSLQALSCVSAFVLAIVWGRAVYQHASCLKQLIKLSLSLSIVFAGAITLFQMYTKVLTFSSDNLWACLSFMGVNLVAAILGAITRRRGLDPIMGNQKQGPTRIA